jgi:uncharacterized membrane protein
MVFGGQYKKRLTRDLVRWQQQGWLSEEARLHILHDVTGSRHAHLSTTFALLGALLLGLGAITFIAANWQQLSGLTKLLIGLGSLCANTGLLFALDRQQHSHWLFDGLVLLLVILFGANIMLIAQTFHINAHWPNGILLWSLGAVAISLLLNSQLAMVAALLLSMLWSGSEALEFKRFMLAYPGFLALVGGWIVFKHWSLALRLWGLSLIWWLGIEVLGRYDPGPEALQLLWLTGFILLFAGLMLGKVRRLAWTAPTFVDYGALAVLGMGWLLSFPELLNWGHTEVDSWLAMRLLAGLIVLGLGLMLMRYFSPQQLSPWLPILATLILITPEWFASPWVPVAFNLFYFAGLLLLIWQANMAHDRRMQSIALGFFLLSLLGRYFDTFWDLLDRSLFFSVGGLLLMAGGWWFARRRQHRGDGR